MSRRANTKKAKKSGLSEHHKKKNFIGVSMLDRAVCWCQGFRVGCGQTLGRSQRFKHKADERKSKERGSLTSFHCLDAKLNYIFDFSFQS
jgi:hypothetical protein